MEIEGGMMQDDSSIDVKEGLTDKDEVMLRRMKNRERQRRYRERKRMREEEAGISEHLSFEATMTQQQDQEEEEDEEEGDEEEEEEEEYNNGYVGNIVRRVYCSRDWKKEARRAHLTGEGYCGSFKRKIWPRRRDWKAEARKKKQIS